MDDNALTLKQQAADEVLKYIEHGMIVGLGHGSTAILAVRGLGKLLTQGKLHDIRGVACSRQIEEEAIRLGIPLIELDAQGVDLTFDGADEVDPKLNVIKGGGGALLREKIVAQASRREIIIVDESKVSPALGTHWALPVEVIPFGWRSQAAYLEGLGARPALRRGRPDGEPFRTDQGNYILDCNFGPMEDPVALGDRLDARTGIVGHGLFLGLVTEVIVAAQSGTRLLTR
jgi:ribose 5-phosphate isomerase A